MARAFTVETAAANSIITTATAKTHLKVDISDDDTLRFWYHKLDCNASCNNDKPHVIYGYVIVDPGCLLNLNEGAQIYLHKN